MALYSPSQVNKLTRELSELRARTSSVTSIASSASSSSALDSEVQGLSMSSLIASAHPISTRRHRSSSSLSTLSTSGLAPGAAQSQASVDRARDAGGKRSRGNSIVPPSLISVTMPAPPRSRAPSVSPSPAAHQQGSAYFSPMQQSPYIVPIPSPSRYEDVAAARSVLEAVRKENETLTARVRELEALLKLDHAAG